MNQFYKLKKNFKLLLLSKVLKDRDDGRRQRQKYGMQLKRLIHKPKQMTWSGLIPQRWREGGRVKKYIEGRVNQTC